MAEEHPIVAPPGFLAVSGFDVTSPLGLSKGMAIELQNVRSSDQRWKPVHRRNR